MHTRRKTDPSALFKVIPLLITAFLIVLCLVQFKKVTFQDIVNYTPENYFLASLLLIGIYAVKSMSVIFPLTALFLAAGVIFPFWAAVLVNLIGLFVSITIPYCIGKFSGKDFVDKLAQRYPKFEKLLKLTNSNDIFTSYVTRAVGAVPGDVVSMLLGASGIKYGAYVAGSLLGMFPGMILQTLMGKYIEHPFSWPFLLLFAAMTGVALTSTLIFNKKSKAKSRKDPSIV